MSSASNRVWKHNALLGGIGMAQAGMERISRADSTTDEAKDMAVAIWNQLEKLKKLTKVRVD